MMFSTKGKLVRSLGETSTFFGAIRGHERDLNTPTPPLYESFLYRYNLGYNRNPPPGSYKLPYHLPEPYRLHNPKYMSRNYQKRRSCLHGPMRVPKDVIIIFACFSIRHPTSLSISFPLPSPPPKLAPVHPTLVVPQHPIRTRHDRPLVIRILDLAIRPPLERSGTVPNGQSR